MAPEDFGSIGELTAAIYEHYYADMKKIACDILRDMHMAEDAVQDSMIKIIKNINVFRDIYSKKCKNFILIIVRNTAIDIYRKNKLDNSRFNYCLIYTLPDMPCDDNVYDIIENEHGFSPEMIRFLKSLTSKERDAIILYYGYGFSHNEITELLGMKKANTTRKMISRAIKHLAKIIEKEGLQ